MLDLLTTKVIAINRFVCTFFTLFAYILCVLNYGNNGIFWKKYIFQINLIFQITRFERIINNKLIPYLFQYILFSITFNYNAYYN